MHHHVERHTALAPRPLEVSEANLQARHPMVLPSHVCVRCGSTEPGGTIRTDTVTWVSPWIWLTMLISWLITFIAYLVTRKQVKLQYYLCPSCADRRKIRTVTSGLVTMIATFGFVVAIVAGETTMLAPLAGVLGLSTLGWLIFASPPMRMRREHGRFSLTGPAPRVIAALERNRLEYQPSSPGERHTNRRDQETW